MSSITDRSWPGTSNWASVLAPDALGPISPPTGNLDFLVAAAASGHMFLSYERLDLMRWNVKVAGVGAASVVQIGKITNGRLVAVKVDRAGFQPLPRTEPTHFGRYLSQLAKELRILSHDRLRRNPHIIDVLGFGAKEQGGSHFCFLAEEYSELGDLRCFLQSRSHLPLHQRLGFCLGIAEYVLLGSFSPPRHPIRSHGTISGASEGSFIAHDFVS